MVKKVVRRRKVVGKKSAKSAAPVLEVSDDEVAIAPEMREIDAAGEEMITAEKLRLEAMKVGGREQKKIAGVARLDKEMRLPVARGAATCSVVTEDLEWCWYGDKNGNVFRCHLPSKGEWVQMGRHKGHVLCMAITTVENTEVGLNVRGDRSSVHMADAKIPCMLATGSSDGVIKIWNGESGAEVHELLGHRNAVTGVSFRLGKNILVSSSYDRTLKVWAAEDAVMLDTFYGHTGVMTSVSAGWKEEAFTTGDDCTARLFRVEKGTQTAYAEGKSVVEGSCFVSDQRYLACGLDGTVKLFDTTKRRPICVVSNAHGEGWQGDGDGLEQVMSREEIDANLGVTTAAPQHANWVMAVAAVPYSDLAVSGGVGGDLRFYRLSDASTDEFIPTSTECNVVRPLFSHKVSGIVSSLAFTRTGQCLVATVGREPRLGRWITDRSTVNHILIVPMQYDGQAAAADEESDNEMGADEEDVVPSPAAAPKKPAVKRVVKKLIKRKKAAPKVTKRKQLVLK